MEITMQYNSDYVVDQPVEKPTTIRFYNALRVPLQQKCGELTLLFDRANPKDLQQVFPVLIENIFGSSGSSGWGLHTITSEANYREFCILHHFLGPLGPVFRFIYKLLSECYIRYEYPLSQLPAKIRTNLENGHISPFYSDLIYQDVQTRQLLCLQLNPFDYYMFQFGWHLISPWQQRNIAGMINWSSWNTLYYVLSCDYLLHFLPTDPYNPIPLPHVSPQYTGKNPLVSHLTVQNRNMRTSKLFRPQVLQQATMEMNTLHQTYQQHPRSEIWRSETVIQMFIDLWLTNDHFYNPVDLPYLKQTPMYELPSAEYIRIIRVGIKQLHAFVDSGKNDMTPIGELKQLVMPMVQGKMYIFLRHLIHRWPLDGSFRLLLELWLSFIQPWRYTANYSVKNSKKTTEEDEINTPSKEIDRRYLRFIADNLLAYTIIFQQLLPRFLRIDLTSPKNAILIYRVTKVFAQPNLVSMIKEVESCVDNRNHSPSHSYSGLWSTLPPLSPTSNWSTNRQINTSSNLDQHASFMSTFSPNRNQSIELNRTTAADHNQSYMDSSNSTPIQNGRWTAIVRQHIFDLEGPEFYYKPMFTDKPAEEVIELFNVLRQSIVAVKHFLLLKEESIKSKQTTFFGYFVSLFTTPTSNGDEFTLEERKKVPSYLELAQQYLMIIFNLDPVVFQTDQVQHKLNQSYYADAMNSSNDVSANLTNTSQREQMLNKSLTPECVRKRAATIHYQGDPDLIPASSYESAILVNILLSVSKKINELYGPTIEQFYHRADFYGSLARQLIKPPRLIQTYNKSAHGAVSPRVQRMLPPRISLRYFASYKFIYSLAIVFVVGRLLGYNSIITFLLCLLLASIYILIKAVFERNRIRNNMQQEWHNISEVNN